MSTLSQAAATARNRWGEPAASKIPGAGRLQRAAQAGTIISVVVIGVVALIGILIFAQINDALPVDALYADPTNETGPTALGNASESVTGGFAGAMELVPIVLLVLVAALVIGVVQRMRQR